MNNRERLNTLSDEEMANEILQYQRNGLRKHCKNIDCIDISCPQCLADWLSQPHETTADEDFAEIGFKFEVVTEVGFFYRKKERMAELRVWVDEKSTHYMSVGGWFFTDKEIDQIRTIADKKRKEMGWK
jgi:hypothetical protein